MFKDKFREIRKSMGLTQMQFAEKLNISRSYVNDLERGRIKGTNVNLISRLSDLTGKPMEYFIDKDVKLNNYEVLDKTIDVLIDKGWIDSKGNFVDNSVYKILLDVLKKEIELKIKNKEGE